MAITGLASSPVALKPKKSLNPKSLLVKKNSSSLGKKAARAPGSAAAAHPAYFQMIQEAIASLKERTGSSQYAIAKFIDDKYKSALPNNFKKMLAVQLKNLSKQGKLMKVKASFKLSGVSSKALKGDTAVKSHSSKSQGRKVPKPAKVQKAAKLLKTVSGPRKSEKPKVATLTPRKPKAPLSGARKSTSTPKLSAPAKKVPAILRKSVIKKAQKPSSLGASKAPKKIARLAKKPPSAVPRKAK
eukprot:c10495_g1_i1 orf=128-856(+)